MLPITCLLNSYRPLMSEGEWCIGQRLADKIPRAILSIHIWKDVPEPIPKARRVYGCGTYTFFMRIPSGKQGQPCVLVLGTEEPR